MNLHTELEKKVGTKCISKGSLGDLEEIGKQVGMILKTNTPHLIQPQLLLFAADHGLSSEGISNLPANGTSTLIEKIIKGDSAVNALIQGQDVTLKVVDCGVSKELSDAEILIKSKVNYASNHIMEAPALSADDISKSFDYAKALMQREEIVNSNCIGFGNIGVGSSSSATLIMSALFQLRLEECIGKGSGIDLETFKRKYQLLEEIQKSYNTLSSPIAILSAFGGLEIGMMMASMLEAYSQNKVIIIDGFVSTVALALAKKIEPQIQKNTIFSHLTEEKGHLLLLQQLDAKPILSLGLRQDEGIGILMSMPIIQGALKLFA